MSKPRLFISHSARGDLEAEALLDDLRRALGGKFALRIDQDDILLGADWRRSINTWIGGCDAAVVLLTPQALKSSFVAYEAGVLAFRKKLYQDFTLVPVYLQGVREKEVQASLLAPSDIQTFQGRVYGDDRAQVVAAVEAALAGVEREEDTPVYRQAEFIETYLQDVGEPLIRRCLRGISLDLGEWDFAGNPRMSLALKLMTMRLADAVTALRPVRAVLRDRNYLEDVFELVATSWVDLRAAARLKELSRGAQAPRKLAVNGCERLTADIYVWRASELPATDSWKVVETSGVFGEGAAAKLKADIRRALREGFGLETDKEVADLLDSREQRGEPVFVVLRAEGVGGEVLGELREEFQTVTFFFLAGPEAKTREQLEAMSVEYLVPELVENFEKQFCDLYRKSKADAFAF